ncbi:hypothetical protein DICVIV_09414 [Dictyocaulus viviparus]|uniref:Uncharacterized protein n=1 Tax=Dictyocaulus viviparus TaxID=29172 RepID=A0A0D8XL72_DICVI|nr:hypothetical protein DICVIV_09414 [Dictyocaulus viviparus]
MGYEQLAYTALCFPSLSVPFHARGMLRIVQKSVLSASRLGSTAAATLSEDLRNRIDKMVKVVNLHP